MSNAATLPTEQVVVGDCIERMNEWPAGSVDLIFADPPYNIGYTYDRYDDNRPDDEYVAWTQRWVDACARLLKPSGSLYILIGDEFAAETRLHLKELERDSRLRLRNWIIWHFTFGQNCTAKFNRSHVHLFYCVGSAATSNNWKASDPPFTFNRSAIAIPSARQTTYADTRANPKGKLPDDTWCLRPKTDQLSLFEGSGNGNGNGTRAKEGPPQQSKGPADDWILRPQEVPHLYFRSDEDTWYLSRLCGTFNEREGWHPCQLPEALLERILKVSSNEGDLVFDPFVGSGTTLAVAARLGRRWLGCELSEEYAERAAERARVAARVF